MSNRHQLQADWHVGATSRIFPLKNAHTAILLVAVTIAALFIHRPDQFFHPYIWIEDGLYTLKAFADRGAYTLIEPISGYHVLACKLIAYLAYKISILWAPEIEMLLTVLVTCGVVLTVAFAPTYLRYRPLCAIAPLVLPIAPEPYATAAYINWWTGIPLLLAPLWKTGHQWLRLFFIVLGGLSTPVIFPVTIVLLFRAGIERTRQEATALLVALLICSIQLATIIIHKGLVESPPLTLGMVRIAIDKFAGFFFVGSITTSNERFAGIGFVVLAALAGLAYFRKGRLDRYFLLLVTLYALICAAIAVRGPVDIYHPIYGGPRYFFFPMTVMVWICLWLASEYGIAVQAALGSAFLFALAGTGSKLIQRDDAMDWRGHIRACANSETSTIPIHFNGKAADAWKLTLSPEDCRSLIARSLIR